MNEAQTLAHNTRLTNRIAVLETRIAEAMQAHKKQTGILASAVPMKVKKWRLEVFAAKKALV